MKHEIKQYVFMSYEWSDDYSGKVWRPGIWRFKPDDNIERVFISERMFTVEIPDDFDPVLRQVAALEQQKRDALDAYTRKVAEINEQLSKLQALEFTA